jgi:MFS transporter, FHS family, Na+ dependent glucose transporter 1
VSLPATTLSTESAPPARAARIFNTVGYYAAFVGLGLTTASLGPTLSSLAEHTQSNLREISFLFTARSLGYLLGSLLGGRLYDRTPGHPVMATALIVMAVTLFLVPLMPLLWLLTAVLLVLGVAEGMADVGGNTLLVWVHRREVGPFMNGLHFFFGVGTFLSPIIIAQAVLFSGDITWAYWALAFLMLPVVVGLARLPSPVAQKVSKDGPIGQVNHWLVVLVSVFFFLYVGAEVSFGGWIFTYAVAMGLTGKIVAAYLTSAFWGSFTLGRLLAIPIAARVRPRYILLADFVGCLISVGVIVLWSHSATVIWLGTFGMGLCMASIFPTTISWAGRRMTITGQVTGWFFVGSSLGGMVLAWLIGQLFESVGPQATMFAILFDLMVALGVFVVLMLYSSRPDKQEMRASGLS